MEGYLIWKKISKSCKTVYNDSPLEWLVHFKIRLDFNFIYFFPGCIF